MQKPRSKSVRLRLETLEDRLTPATFSVTTVLDVVQAGDGVLSLREAINRANATPEADTIELAAGNYRIKLAGPGENANASGDFDITSPLTIIGQGASATVIDAQYLDRVFDVIGSSNASFSKLKICNGDGPIFGGGIQALTANITLDQCWVTRNTALKGGGINAENGNVTVIDSMVSYNKATDATIGSGGGIRAAAGRVTLTSSTVMTNRATTLGGGIQARFVDLTDSSVHANSARRSDNFGFGGGIHATDTVTLTNSTVNVNMAGSRGGGIFAVTVTATNSNINFNSALSGSGGGIDAFFVTVTSSTISGNVAVGGGGGIVADGNGIHPAFVTMTNSTVSGNIAHGQYSGFGGGIYSKTVTLTNSTISGNSASIEGGGIYAERGSLLNVTVTKNKAIRGGGVVHSGPSALSVKNTIIAQNTTTVSGGFGPDVRGVFSSQGHNLIGIVDGSGGFGAAGDRIGTKNAPLDPRLGPLANNGGPTFTHALLTGSVAINGGDNNGAPASDQRGVLRLAPVDIGAFEVVAGGFFRGVPIVDIVAATLVLRN